MTPDQNTSLHPVPLRVLLAGGLALAAVLALLFGVLTFSSWLFSRGSDPGGRGLTQEERLEILAALSGTIQRSDAEREAALTSMETRNTISEEQKLRVLESLQ